MFELSEPRAPEQQPGALQKHEQLTYAQANTNPTPLTIKSNLANSKSKNTPDSLHSLHNKITPENKWPYLQNQHSQSQSQKVFPDTYVKLDNVESYRDAPHNELAQFFGW